MRDESWGLGTDDFLIPFTKMFWICFHHGVTSASPQTKILNVENEIEMLKNLNLDVKQLPLQYLVLNVLTGTKLLIILRPFHTASTSIFHFKSNAIIVLISTVSHSVWDNPFNQQLTWFP